MFSDKKNINILTSLLVVHGVKRVVVCPGSRNAPIVHNFNECDDITCYPVTDERSAGFYALGMALADDSPVAVCVTSGTALLNVVPAVAEASYRHRGIVVISADRPLEWIDQLDGQTLPQNGAFGRYVSKCVSLPEPNNEQEHWYCNRLINEALIAVRTHERKSVHINVHINEPLFNFTLSKLPVERKIGYVPSIMNIGALRAIAERMLAAHKPMVIVGQTRTRSSEVADAIKTIGRKVVVISETLASDVMTHFDLMLSRIGKDERYMPDFILYLGDNMVSKRLKKFLRLSHPDESWAVSEDHEIHDTFMHLTGLIEADYIEALNELAEMINGMGGKQGCKSYADNNNVEFRQRWKEQIEIIDAKIASYEPQYSQMSAVKEFEESLADMDYGYQVHYANSSAVRLADIYADHYVWCNRGVNGIEGSLSTAAGFSVVCCDMVFCVIGDLSFFYDQNALWNTNLGGNFRILLLNNGGGGIFYNLKGLKESHACEKLVAACHTTTAQGICTQNDIGYVSARNDEELRLGIAMLLTSETKRPMLLEVFTDISDDSNALIELVKNIK